MAARVVVGVGGDFVSNQGGGGGTSSGGGTGRADYNAGTAQVFRKLGYRFDTGQVALEPFAGLAYVNLHTAGPAGSVLRISM